MFCTMFDRKILIRAKLCIMLSFITFCAMIFLLCEDIRSPHYSLNHEAPEKFQLQLQKPRIQKAIESTLSHIPVEDEEEEVDRGNQKPLVPPLNVTEKERMAWFRKRFHDFKIFESNNLTRQFHARVVRLFRHECEAQFFMTWISPASLFGNRELLSLESLFKAHPQACLAILSRTLDSKQGYKILKPLIDRGFKVQAVTPNLPFLFRRTPAEKWLHDLIKGKKDPGEIPLPQNLSNLIRLVVLYKYGGIYLDTDFIILKPFKGLRNCIGAQSTNSVSKHWTRLNNAVLVFDKNHPLLLRFIQEFALNFNGNKWGYNGPYLVSRVVERVKAEGGLNLRVLPPMAFYPVDWTRVGGWFQKPKNRDEARWVRAKLIQLRGQTYGVHLWNKWSGKLAIQQGSVMAKLMSHHCIFCNNVYSS
ncbi:lactosylceramide 4-alpha-galactosyltransferase-like [Neltuma alba]|uniref:lactosylceramide 4-alpha-galactosyltransferase-like n=1 Tax=Neltuma alba TaxID=207710 RepID=UPI0010A42E7A|nr:lactosylceramide 4-alpha-galactosyltransferase-like [Prosopis alba]